jgi:hypothetical protein
VNAKLKSRKFWFTIWAALTASVVMFFSIYKGYDASWMPGTLSLLVSVVAAYVGIGIAKRRKEE